MNLRAHRASITRSPGARMVAAALLTIGLAATTAPVDAHENDTAGQSADCPPGLQRELNGEAGDNFAMGCLPGQDIAKLDDSGATLAPGETASSPNLSLIANIPKQGAFAAETAYNSDLAFKDDYAFAGNYNGFMVYDVKQAADPAEGGDPGRLPRLTERRVGLRQPAGPQRRLQPQRRLVLQHLAVGNDRGVVGGHPGLRHHQPRRRRSTSPRSRPTAAPTPTRWRRRRTAATSTCTSRRTRRTPRSRTASRRTTASAW